MCGIILYSHPPRCDPASLSTLVLPANKRLTIIQLPVLYAAGTPASPVTLLVLSAVYATFPCLSCLAGRRRNPSPSLTRGFLRVRVMTCRASGTGG